MESLQVLKSALDSFNNEEIVNCLKQLLEKGCEFEIVNNEIIIKLLKSDEKEVQNLSSELIAELAKNQNNRHVLTKEEIIQRLMTFLTCEDRNLIFSAIRALGNICYENEEAANVVDKIGINSIITVLKTDSDRSDTSLTTKASGLLVNLLSSHDNLPKTALKDGLLKVSELLLIKYKKSFKENQLLLTFLLSIVNNLCYYLDDQNINFGQTLGHTLVDIFKISENAEISVTCLEIFHGQSENDEIKCLLAKEGVCELLFELIEKYRHKVNDEDSRSVLKMACDLIVIILTGDYCMYLLYDNGNGKTYENMLTWLDSEDPDLLSTGILALGNFARKDTHCIQMVQRGISKKLIDILGKYNESTDINDVKIQHALLSTLKNLVIPKENKEQVLSENLIEVMYPMIKLDRYMVVFKLLGCYRMVIDTQEVAALDLLSRKEFIERLVYWCYNSDHLGVRGEVPRLFSWLIKNCHSFRPFGNFISVPDSVRCIVEMISSNHAVMQNEAFYALNLLLTWIATDKEYAHKLYEDIVKADIGKNLNFVLNKYGDKWDAHTVENFVNLFQHLVKSEEILEHFQVSDVSKTLSKLLKNGNAGGVSDKLNEIIGRFAAK